MQKIIGIIGGIGPASTPDYYLGIIDGCRARTQDGHYPKLLINSIDMTEMLSYVTGQDWNSLVTLLVQAIRQLADAGAEIAAIASNTPHIVFDRVRERVTLPLISIIEATCKQVQASGLYTEAMEKYGIAAVVPSEEEQDVIHGIIFPNLENGVVLLDEKQKLLHLAQSLSEQHHTDSFILGCTELPLAIQENDLDCPVFNTTQIHINAIVQAMTEQ